MYMLLQFAVGYQTSLVQFELSNSWFKISKDLRSVFVRERKREIVLCNVSKQS